MRAQNGLCILRLLSLSIHLHYGWISIDDQDQDQLLNDLIPDQIDPLTAEDVHRRGLTSDLTQGNAKKSEVKRPDVLTGADLLPTLHVLVQERRVRVAGLALFSDPHELGHVFERPLGVADEKHARVEAQPVLVLVNLNRRYVCFNAQIQSKLSGLIFPAIAERKPSQLPVM